MAQYSTTIAFGDGNHGFQAGLISGPVHNEFHLPSKRPETPPSPSANIPFRRDPDFIDRRTLLDQIREKCSVPASRIALVGLGGVGKSQLAIEHCYRTAEWSPETWVFWVHSSNAARLEQSFRDIADRVKLAGRKDPQVDVFKLVHDWLRDERHGKWLLVLDNADSAAVLSPSSDDRKTQADSSRDGALGQHLSRYLPPSRYGSVLVTSRTKQAASRLVEESDIIQIEPMHDASAQALLEKKLGDKVNKDGIAELAAALEYMPLALVQAAAYIQKRAPRCSVRQYLEEFRRSDKKKTSLLNHEAGHLRRDEEAKNSIVITWQISFDHIQSTRQSAADLLSLMSFFDRQGIPEALLRDQGDTGEDHEGSETDDKNDEECDEESNEENDQESDEEGSISEASINDRFEDDISTLRDYCFISITTDVAMFEMHSLVQLATRKWLESRGQLEKWRQQFIANLFAEFPTGQFESWGKCQSLLPHATSALAQKPKSKESRKKWALLLRNAAYYMWQRGSVGEAEKMSMCSMEVRKELFGTESVETLSSMAMVGLVRALGGRWEEAEELFVQVMETRKRVLGEEHPSTLTSMANLATTYRNQGRWKEAKELEVPVIETSLRVLGEEHPSTLTSMANLASTYRNQGRWKEAEELQAKELKICSRVLGKEHPSTLTSMSNLASMYQNQGRWKEAEELEVQVIEIKKRVLGEEHPSTLTSIANLASTYWNQGRWKEAEELFMQVMEISKRVLGEEHPSTLTHMNNLAYTLKGQGYDNKAVSLMEECFQLRKQVLSPQHPYTMSSLSTLNKWRLEKVDIGS